MDTLKKYITSAITIAVAGVIIGFSLGWYFRGEQALEIVNQNNNQGVERNLPEDTKESIIISDQVSGDSVLVSRITIKEDSWIAVREIINGNMGNILGALRLLPGEYMDVSITLLRPTISSGEYSAVIYRDSGRGEFEYNFDSLVTDGNKPISAYFKTF